MSEHEVTEQTLNNFVQDAAYLADEAEALKFVIESVPYAVTPAGGMSICNKLRLINHAQNNYFKPVIESVFSENSTIRLASFEHYTDTFETEPDEDTNVEKVLQLIIKNRGTFLNMIEKFPYTSWERTLTDKEGETIYLLDFAREMIRDERKLLKEIADLVMIYQKEREQQREIDKKAASRQRIADL